MARVGRNIAAVPRGDARVRCVRLRGGWSRIVSIGAICASSLRAGTAGQVEVVLWQYAYGKPKDVQGHDGEVTIRVEYEQDVDWREELAGRLNKIAARRAEAAKETGSRSSRLRLYSRTY